jgi:glycine/D-amino acid oxidase-like deaminating enzyme
VRDAAGFGGHGLMHAPAANSFIMELIVDGGPLDISALAYERLRVVISSGSTT